MAIYSKNHVTALAVLAVTCVSLLAYQSATDKSGTNPTEASDTNQRGVDSSSPTGSNNLPSEPKIAAAIPVDAQSWTILPNINNGRFESTAIQYRDDLYVFNGFGLGIDVEPAVEKFDAGTQSWSVIANASIALGNAVTHNGVIVQGNEVWMLGGRVGNHPGAVTSKVWKFNLTTHTWSPGPELPVPVAAGGAALVDNRIHWFGGLDANAQCDVADHYVYDLDNPSAGWSDITSIAPMPIPRNHFATVVHEGLIYAIGGQFTHDGCGAGTPDTDLVHVFNPKTSNWTQMARLPAIQSHIEPSTFVHKGAIYVVGGATSGNKVYRYDPSNDDWDTVAVLPQALLAPAARVIDNQLIVSSGGAPATIPSLTTYATDMTPLLLPDVDNTIPDPDPVVITEIPSDPVTVPVTVLDDDAGLVSLEAEFYDTLLATDSHQWVPVNLAGASNNSAMTTTPDSNELAIGSQNSPSMAYFAHFDRPGIWYLWVRGWGDTVNGEGKSDSLHAGLNGSLSATADNINEFPPGWVWSSNTRDGVRASLDIPTAGIHAVNLWMREDGLAVDQILLTTDQAFVPSGVGLEHDSGITATDSQAEQEAVDNINDVIAEDDQVATVPITESDSSETDSSETTSNNDTATSGLPDNEGTTTIGSQVEQEAVDSDNIIAEDDQVATVTTESDSSESKTSETTSNNDTATGSSGGGSQYLIDLLFLLVLLGFLTITQTPGNQRGPVSIKRYTTDISPYRKTIY